MYPDGLTKEELVDMLHGCWSQLQLLGSSSRRKPAQSRWWSLALSLAQQVCAFTVNGALPDILEIAFPTWQSGEPEAEEGEALPDIDYRKMIRSKVYRSKLYTKDHKLRRLATCVLFCAEDIDHLGMRLQHESVNGSILLAVLHDDTNPFVEAQLEYAKFLCHPSEEHIRLKVLEHFYGGDEAAEQELCALIMELCLTNSSMLWFYCEIFLKGMPFPLAALADVRTPDKTAVLRKHVYDSLPCEADPGMTAKIVEAHPTAEGWLSDVSLMAGINLWARHTRVENMCCERLLASFRKADP